MSAEILFADAPEYVDWGSVRDDACERLSRYIRFVTVNDPDKLDVGLSGSEPWRAGSEIEAIRWLEGLLRAEGVGVEVFQSAPGRANLIARIPGEIHDHPIVLLSHADVVPADASDWMPGLGPFSGAVRDGYLYGRGALDLKGLGIAHLMCVLLLHRHRIPLKRDVVLLIVADEEAGGHYGAECLLRARPELLRAFLVLGEGAYSFTSFHGVDKSLQAISVAEKGYLELELNCETSSQHASMPSGIGAVEQLARSIVRIMDHKPRARLTEATRPLLHFLGARHGSVAGWLLRHPELALRSGLLDRSHGPIIDSMLHDTVTATILEAGCKTNVMPRSARAVLSIRLLPGSDPVGYTAAIERVIANPSVTVTRLKGKDPTSSPFDNAEYATLRSVAGEDGSDVVPILSPGASDCRFWRHAGVACYGWVPFKIDASDLHSVHGPNERVSVEAFGLGIQMLYRALLKLSVIR